MITEGYRLGGGLSLALQTSDPAAIRFYRQEYAWMEGQGGAKGVTLRWHHRALPALQLGEGTYHVHKLAARWRYRLELLKDRIEVAAIGNRWSLPMVHHMLVHPSLRLLASRRGLMLLHGAALVHEGRTVVLTGPGGSGKTTTTSLLLAHGRADWKLHADDYLILTADGRTHAYLTRAHLYLDLLEGLPGLREVLGPGEQRRAEIFGRLRRWSGERVKWPVRVRLDRLWPQRESAPEGQLAAIFILERSKGRQLKVEGIERKGRAIAELLAMNFKEAKHFLRLLEKASGADEVARLRSAWEGNEGALLARVAAQVPVHSLILPAEGRPFVELVPPLEEAILHRLGQSVSPQV